MGSAKLTRLTPERIALLEHPLILVRLNLKFAWNSLDSVHWFLASGNARGACECLSKARGYLDECEQMIVDNARIAPYNFLENFFCESGLIRREICLWAHSGIAEGLADYRRCLEMVFTI